MPIYNFVGVTELVRIELLQLIYRSMLRIVDNPARATSGLAEATWAVGQRLRDTDAD
jgi:hypothetical protein